jgi:hypothetical protein
MKSIKIVLVIMMLFILAGCSGNIEESDLNYNDGVVGEEIEYLDFDVENIEFTKTIVLVDEGGFYSWPFEGDQETVELEIDYSDVMSDIERILEKSDDIPICDGGPFECTLFGPTPAFYIEINDGIHFYTIAIEVEDFILGQRISDIRIMEGSETKLTVPKEELSTEYKNIYVAIKDAYNYYIYL